MKKGIRKTWDLRTQNKPTTERDPIVAHHHSGATNPSDVWTMQNVSVHLVQIKIRPPCPLARLINKLSCKLTCGSDEQEGSARRADLLGRYQIEQDDLVVFVLHRYEREQAVTCDACSRLPTTPCFGTLFGSVNEIQ